MDPESKKLLEETLALAQENNRILGELRRAMRFSRFMSIMYWVLIVGSAVGAFYFIQPVIDDLMGAYSGAQDSLKQLQKFSY